MLNPRDDRMKWLDRALEGKSDAVKARVLDLILRYGVDPENEFFMLFVAFGYLQVLVEDAPKSWQSLFENFQRELHQWSQQNLRTLQGIIQQSQTLEELTLSLKELTNLIRSLNSTTQDWRLGLQELKPILKQLSEHSSQTVSDNSALLSRLKRIEARLDDQNHLRIWIWSFNFFAAALLMFGVGTIAVGQARLVDAQRVQQQRVNWLLEKANRWECQQGLKAADSPECQSL